MKKTPGKFTDSTFIKYSGLTQDPKHTFHDYIDFYLMETDCDRAILTYDVKHQIWSAMLCETETAEDFFENDYKATKAQVASLVAALTDEAWEELRQCSKMRKKMKRAA